jgi:peptidoglycan/LPS O-acetylase OafA/YrhL
MTLLAHFSPVEIPYRWYGVPIFFTISGFLITTILLNAVNNNPSASRLTITKNFMIRRTLRLLPLYFLFLIFFWLLRHYLFLWKDEYTPYFFTYTPNLYIYRFGSENAGCFAHLWSLGVEEQFYLFWPWLLLFLPARYLMPVIAGMIGLALGYIFYNYNNTRIGAFPLANFHTLGVGALLACWYVQQGAVIAWLKKYRRPLFWITFIHLIVVLVFFRNESSLWHLYREFSLCLCTFFIVVMSIFGWKGAMGYLARNKQIQYIGAISYGIYLFHMPVPFLFRAVSSKLFPLVAISPVPFLFICLGLTVALAALSHRFFEAPILKLKRHFV